MATERRADGLFGQGSVASNRFTTGRRMYASTNPRPNGNSAAPAEKKNHTTTAKAMAISIQRDVRCEEEIWSIAESPTMPAAFAVAIRAESDTSYFLYH